MKKLSLLALPLAMLAFGSCDNNELQSTQTTSQIGVMPVSNVKTNRGYTENNKFYETLTANLHSDDANLHNNKSRMMYLSGYLTPQAGKAMTYFQGATFKEYETTNIWHNYDEKNAKYDPIFWPLGGTMDFLAYSLSGESSCLAPQTVEWGANPSESVALSLPAGCSQNDILYAGKYGVTADKESGNFNMEFKHAQAWIEFILTGSAKDVEGNDVTNGIKIVSIELENIYNTGKLTISKNDATPAAATAAWSFCNGFSKKNIPMDGCNSLESLSDAPQYLDMLIPEQAQTSILMKYCFKNGMVLEYRFTLPGSTMWEMGKKYVYAININANEITVTPTVKMWDEVDGFRYYKVTYTSTVKDEEVVSDTSGTVVAEMISPERTDLNFGEGTEVEGTTVDTIKVWGAQIELTATPKENYEFIQWADDVEDATRTFNITDNFVAPAPVFKRFYYLNVVSEDKNHGKVVYEKTKKYYRGDEVTIVAVPKPGYKFKCWYDNTNKRKITDAGAGATYTFELTHDKAIITYEARFAEE